MECILQDLQNWKYMEGLMMIALRYAAAPAVVDGIVLDNFPFAYHFEGQ